MLIIITGCFKERATKDQSIRYFDRVFTIVPEGTGFCIMNEQWFLTTATPEQQKQLLNPIIIPPQVEPTVEPADDVKQQMLITLSQQTNMNAEWCLKCLQEVQWIYDAALSAFNEFFKCGLIPPEAFNQTI